MSRINLDSKYAYLLEADEYDFTVLPEAIADLLSDALNNDRVLSKLLKEWEFPSNLHVVGIKGVGSRLEITFAQAGSRIRHKVTVDMKYSR